MNKPIIGTLVAIGVIAAAGAAAIAICKGRKAEPDDCDFDDDDDFEDGEEFVSSSDVTIEPAKNTKNVIDPEAASEGYDFEYVDSLISDDEDAVVDEESSTTEETTEESTGEEKPKKRSRKKADQD